MIAYILSTVLHITTAPEDRVSRAPVISYTV